MLSSNEKGDFALPALGPHGTRVAAKIAGIQTGIAKSAELRIVVMPNFANLESIVNYIDALMLVYDDIITERSRSTGTRDKPILINFSYCVSLGFTSILVPLGLAELLREMSEILLNRLLSLKDVIFVNSQPNTDRPPGTVNIPYDTPPKKNFVVVGSMNSDTGKHEFKLDYAHTPRDPDIWAPGTHIYSPYFDLETFTKKDFEDSYGLLKSDVNAFYSKFYDMVTGTSFGQFTHLRRSFPGILFP